jgi:hypothetical protein
MKHLCRQCRTDVDVRLCICFKRRALDRGDKAPSFVYLCKQHERELNRHGTLEVPSMYQYYKIPI